MTISRSIHKNIIVGIIIAILLAGLAVAVYVVQQQQDIRQRAATPTGSARITLLPSSSSISPGSSIIIALIGLMNTPSAIDGFQVVAELSGTIPNNIQFQPSTIPGLQVVKNEITQVNNKRLFRIAFLTTNPTQPYIATASAGVASTIKLGHFTLTAPQQGQMTIHFDPTLSKIMTHTTSSSGVSVQDILAIPTDQTYIFSTATPPPATPPPSPTASPTTTASPSPTATSYINTFTIRTRFVGITQDRGPIPVQFYLGKMGSTTALMDANVSLIGDTQGFYTATFTVSPANLLPLPDRYWITIKGRKHLQRAYSNLTIPDGGMIDLTSKLQEPGDLPTQDGVVDNTDLNKVLEILAKPTQDATDLTTADVNYDGVVNAVDLGLILTTLSVKPDETIQ